MIKPNNFHLGFLAGLGSILNIAGVSFENKLTGKSVEKDLINIRNDWRNVGKNLQEALGKSDAIQSKNNDSEQS